MRSLPFRALHDFPRRLANFRAHISRTRLPRMTGPNFLQSFSIRHGTFAADGTLFCRFIPEIRLLVLP